MVANTFIFWADLVRIVRNWFFVLSGIHHSRHIQFGASRIRQLAVYYSNGGDVPLCSKTNSGLCRQS
jgi:hypothetical protein